jgi:hypothetical protein
MSILTARPLVKGHLAKRISYYRLRRYLMRFALLEIVLKATDIW